MQNILTLISDTAYIDLPHGFLGWVGWVMLLAILAVGMRHWWERGYGKMKQRWWLLAALGLAVPITALFIGIRLPGNESLTLPNVPVESSTPAMMFFMAVPWVLAAGLFGTLPSVVIGLLSGLFFAFWETHSAFTPLEFALFALIFSASVRQRYRTNFYHYLRNPLGAATVVGIFYIPISIVVAFFSSNGDAAVRVDYALTGSWILLLARTAELVVACILAEIVYLLTPKLWGQSGPLVPSPAETSLQTRFFFWTFPLILVLLLTLVLGDWIVAGNAAREMIRERLSSTAGVVSDSLPYFLESGQGLLLNQARPELFDLDANNQNVELTRILRSVAFLYSNWFARSRRQVDCPVTGGSIIFIERTRESCCRPGVKRRFGANLHTESSYGGAICASRFRRCNSECGRPDAWSSDGLDGFTLQSLYPASHTSPEEDPGNGWRGQHIGRERQGTLLHLGNPIVGDE